MDIIWKEQGFIYNEEYRELNEQTLLLDGRLSREEAAAHPHVYCDIQELLPVVNFRKGVWKIPLSCTLFQMSIGLMTLWQQIPCKKKKGIELPSVCM